MNEFNNSFVKNFLNVPTIVKAVKIQRENDLTKLLILSKIYIRRSERIANQKAKKKKKTNEMYTMVTKSIYTLYCIFINKIENKIKENLFASRNCDIYNKVKY